MKVKKQFISQVKYILLSLLVGWPAFAIDRGFVEAQFQYDRKSKEAKQQEVLWDEQTQTATLTFWVRLSNFKSEWHMGGFDLDLARSAYVTEPTHAASCKLASYGGVIVKGDYVKPSRIQFQLQGKKCKESLELYNLWGSSITFYDVPSLDKEHFTRTVRVYIADAPDQN